MVRLVFVAVALVSLCLSCVGGSEQVIEAVLNGDADADTF